MRIILLAVAVSTAAMAGNMVRPSGCPPAAAISPAKAPAAKKLRKKRSPLHFLKRLATLETDAAMRLSAWGIKEPETKRIATPPACPADAQGN